MFFPIPIIVKVNGKCRLRPPGMQLTQKLFNNSLMHAVIKVSFLNTDLGLTAAAPSL